MASKPKADGANLRSKIVEILKRNRLTVWQYFRQAADEWGNGMVSDTGVELAVRAYEKLMPLPRYVLLAVEADKVRPQVRHYAKSRDLRDARHV